MMYSEFLELSGQDITFKQYSEIVEPMYCAVEQMTKQQFIEFMMPSIKALARRNAEEKKANQKLVFIGDGATTPNGCYYLGCYGKLVSQETNISTGKTTITVRYLTDEECSEVSKSWDLYLNSHIDYNTHDRETKIRWVA